MRTPAILCATLAIILSLTLVSCGVEPQVRVNGQDALDRVKGPAPTSGSVQNALKVQADQAVAAGNYKQAAQLYKQLVDKAPDNKDYQIALADNLRRAGDAKGALHIADGLLKKDPKNPDMQEIKGLTLMSEGEFAEAGVAFGEVMKVDPKRWRTLNGVGILFAMKGKYDGAVAYFQEALNISTDNPSVLNNAALTYAIDHQFDRSYDAFARAKRHVQSDSADAKHLDLNLALVYAVDGKLDEAEQTAAPHLSKQALYNNMGFYSYLAKNNDLAKGYLNMALTQSPTYYERAWRNMGAITGDTSATSADLPQAQPIPGVSLPEQTKLQVPSAPNAPAAIAPAAGIPLSDIPESQPLRSDPNSPYAAQQIPITNVSEPKPIASVTAPAEAQINPDIVLKKPDPAANGNNTKAVLPSEAQ